LPPRHRYHRHPPLTAAELSEWLLDTGLAVEQDSLLYPTQACRDLVAELWVL
jgi:hypothetical protein